MVLSMHVLVWWERLWHLPTSGCMRLLFWQALCVYHGWRDWLRVVSAGSSPCLLGSALPVHVLVGEKKESEFQN